MLHKSIINLLKLSNLHRGNSSHPCCKTWTYSSIIMSPWSWGKSRDKGEWTRCDRFASCSRSWYGSVLIDIHILYEWFILLFHILEFSSMVFYHWDSQEFLVFFVGVFLALDYEGHTSLTCINCPLNFSMLLNNKLFMDVQLCLMIQVK